jgi:hypothetical protein
MILILALSRVDPPCLALASESWPGCGAKRVFGAGFSHTLPVLPVAEGSWQCRASAVGESRSTLPGLKHLAEVCLRCGLAQRASTSPTLTEGTTPFAPGLGASCTVFLAKPEPGRSLRLVGVRKHGSNDGHKDGSQLDPSPEDSSEEARSGLRLPVYGVPGPGVPRQLHCQRHWGLLGGSISIFFELFSPLLLSPNGQTLLLKACLVGWSGGIDLRLHPP